MSGRRLPPVTQLGMISLALVLAGGIYLSAHLPQHVSLGPAVVLLCASAVLLAANLLLLARVRDFAWRRFFEVGRWASSLFSTSAESVIPTAMHKSAPATRKREASLNASFEVRMTGRTMSPERTQASAEL